MSLERRLVQLHEISARHNVVPDELGLVIANETSIIGGLAHLGLL